MPGKEFLPASSELEFKDGPKAGILVANAVEVGSAADEEGSAGDGH